MITVHRRENYGKYLFEICEAIIELANNFKDVDFICPVHPNKNGDYIKSTLSKVKNVKLIKPLQYDYMVFLMTESYFIMTDSGGIQEEAISCNKPILILRENTERIEVIEIGAGLLTYNEKEKIVNYATQLLINEDYYLKMINKENPFGDGDTPQIIFNILENKMQIKSL